MTLDDIEAMTAATISRRRRPSVIGCNEQGAGIEQIATAIWLCSDTDIPENCRRDIILALHEAGFTERQDKSEAEHLMDWLEI